MSKEEQETFVVFFNTFKISRKLDTFADLYDGKGLFEVMAAVDASHFKNSVVRASSSTASTSDNWVLKMNTMKRLYRLLLSYSLPSPHPSLSKSTLREPDFTSIGKGNNKAGLIQVCRMCLVAGVWSPSNEQIIGKIQGLKESQQRILMTVIEEIMDTLPVGSGSLPNSSSERSELADLASGSTAQRTERDELAAENDNLRSTCETLRADLAKIQTSLDEANSEKEDALQRLTTLRSESAAGLKASQGEGRGDLATLREELGKAEEALQLTEGDLDKQTSLVAELTKTVEDLKKKAAESGRLKDQLDEYRHTAERLKKSENVIEKYKKKLEDTAELRRELKSLEEHNARLTNANASLETECKKLGSHKSLVDTYRAQVVELERKNDEHMAEVTELNVALEAARSQVETLVAQSEKDKEDLQLNQDRVKELELGDRFKQGSTSSVDVQGTLGEEMEGTTTDQEDSLETATKTDLKLRVRGLLRKLEAARLASAGDERVVVLEELLSDANRAKERYQAEYLGAHRGRLVLQASIDEIRAGRGDANDAQVSIALRQRLNEAVEELDVVRREQQELQVRFGVMEKDYAIAKSDLHLVDKDQLEALSSLRESVRSEKESLEKTVDELEAQLTGSRDKTRMQLEQINGLLMDKVQLQSVALERTVSGHRLPSESPSELSDQRQANNDSVKLGEDVKILETKLAKAREFIKEQDALIKSKSGDEVHKTALAELQQDLIRTKRATQLLEQRYKLEQQLMLTAWHDLGARTVREHLAHATHKRNQPKPAPSSWLAQQRQKMGSAIFVGSGWGKADVSRDK